MIALMVMTDGRSTIHETIASAEANLIGPITERWIHDDSGDPANAEMLRTRYPSYRLITTSGRSGFGGAIRNAWATLRVKSTATYVFHLEDDFTFNRPVELLDMVRVLNSDHHLMNLALRRQPVNEAEAQAGGVVEQWPDAYVECSMKLDDARALSWLEHRLFWTTNPGLYRRYLIHRHEWPEGSGSEGAFTYQILEDERARFGYYGTRASGEAVHHIGHTRNGTGY